MQPIVLQYATATTLRVVLYSGAGSLLGNPTLAAGDVQVSKDGGALANLGTLPSVSPAASGIVLVTLTAAELTAREVVVRIVDQTSPQEWLPNAIIIRTFGHASAFYAPGSGVWIDSDSNGRTRNAVGNNAGEINLSGGKVPATIATGDMADIPAIRAAKIDNLDQTLTAAVLTIVNQILAAANGPGDASIDLAPVIERPEAGTVTYPIILRFYGDDGASTNVTGTPTFTLLTLGNVNRAALLGAVTNPTTGEYRATLTLGTATALETLILTASFVKDGVSRTLIRVVTIADEVAEKWTASDRNLLSALPTAVAIRSEMDENSVNLRRAAFATPTEVGVADGASPTIRTVTFDGDLPSGFGLVVGAPIMLTFEGDAAPPLFTTITAIDTVLGNARLTVDRDITALSGDIYVWSFLSAAGAWTRSPSAVAIRAELETTGGTLDLVSTAVGAGNAAGSPGGLLRAHPDSDSGTLLVLSDDLSGNPSRCGFLLAGGAIREETFAATGLSAISGRIWGALTSGLTTTGSIGKRLVDFVTTLVYSAPSAAGATPSEIWTYAGGRTLTSFPPSYQLTMPQGGAGVFIPGGRPDRKPVATRVTSLAGASIVLLSRVVGLNGDWIQVATTSAVSVTVLNLKDSADATTAAETVAAVVFDALQLDGRWVEDGAGYNLAIAIAGGRLAAAGTTYRVTVTLTDSSGRPIKLVWEVQT